MSYTPIHKISIFRKVAMGLWGSGGDPSVYGFVDVDVTDIDLKGTSPLPRVIQALAKVMSKYPELNSILRLGSLYQRDTVDISVLVNIPDDTQNDLSFAHLESVDKMDLVQIEKAIFHRADLIRKKKDPRLAFAFKLIRHLPFGMTKLFLKLYSLVVHDLNVNLSALKLPYKPFGAVIVTNVGSLGIKSALVPLVPLSRAAVMVSVGAVSPEPRVVKGQIMVRNIMQLGVTFDHRYFDGSHAAKMLQFFQQCMLKEYES